MFVFRRLWRRKKAISFLKQVLSMQLFSILLIGFLLLSCDKNAPNNNIILDPSDRLRTYTSEDWDNWTCTLEGENGRIRTYTSEDWDNWEYSFGGNAGRIRTYTSEDWDNWEVNNGELRIRTYTSEDWDYWQITGNGIQIKVRTYTSEDWDYWQVSGDITATIRTYTSEDWDNWEITGDLSQLSISTRMAILFIPIFTSSIYKQGICL